MATTLDCFLHPIDCARASEAARTAGAVTGAASGSVAGRTEGATTAAGDIVEASTAPLHELSNTAMWTAVGIGGAVIIVLVIAYAVIHATNRI